MMDTSLGLVPNTTTTIPLFQSGGSGQFSPLRLPFPLEDYQHNCTAEELAAIYSSGRHPLEYDCITILNAISSHPSPDPSDASHDPGPPPRQPGWIQLILQILYGVVCCVGLCGNTLVIYVVVRFSKMQTVTNLYIVNLAIADECFLVGIPFLMTTIALGYWPFGTIVCKAYFISTSINQITSSMFLLIMSADRYLAVCHPISAPRWRTPLIAKFVALTAWTLSALIIVPIYMYANTLEIDSKINCNIFWPNSETWSGESIFIVYSFIISFAVPLLLISIFYVLVILKLKTVGPKRRPLLAASSSSAPGNPSDPGGDGKQGGSGQTPTPQPILTPQQVSRSKERKRSHKKVTKLVLTVITVYFICWAPYWITQMALIFMPHESTHSEMVLTLFLLAGCFSYSNSTMNPILYAFLSDNFKKSFLKACTCAKGQDVNAQLHVENSLFPRGKKSERAKGGALLTASGGGSSTQQPNTNTGMVTATTSATGGGSGGLMISAGGLVGGAKNLLQVPNLYNAKGRGGALSDESGSDEEEEEELASSGYYSKKGKGGYSYHHHIENANGGGVLVHNNNATSSSPTAAPTNISTSIVVIDGGGGLTTDEGGSGGICNPLLAVEDESGQTTQQGSSTVVMQDGVHVTAL